MSQSVMVPGRAAGRRRALIGIGGFFAFLAFLQVIFASVEGFPESWDIGLADAVNDFKAWAEDRDTRTGHWLFTWFFNPISDTVDWAIRRLEDFVLWLPWFVIVAVVFVLLARIRRLGSAILGSAGVIYLGAVGLWEQSMRTLALMVLAVVLALLVGIPLGVWSARSDRVQTALRPFLDFMQTMPAFVYLIPVALFFGIGRVPGVIATVVYAMPPVIRLTNLGIRQVPRASVEAAEMFGSTSRQTLTKVQMPLAMPTILTGVNQTIMMALGIVVIAALIGAGGLGLDVLTSLRRRQLGRGLEAGLAIVVLAMLLDRISASFATTPSERLAPRRFRLFPDAWVRYPTVERIEQYLERAAGFVKSVAASLAAIVLAPWQRIGAGRPGGFGTKALELAGRHRAALGTVVALIGATIVGVLAGWQAFPENISISFAGPVDDAIDWAQVNLFQIGDLPIGTGPFSDFLIISVLTPLRDFFTSTLAWPVLVAAVTIISWRLVGIGLAVFAGASLLFVGLIGVWDLAMDTLSQTIVAVVLSVLIAVPVGILAARWDPFERALRPVLDLLQTIPTFVYLVPVVMLFNVGRMPGIIASVAYAIVPAIRLTNLGIRSVEAEALEASRAFGATPRQTLWKVQIPLAMPSILAGVNQTVLMVLAMVVIAGMVGAGGLGLEAVRGLVRREATGTGFASGLAIVIMAMLLDRITQAVAARTEAPGVS